MSEVPEIRSLLREAAEQHPELSDESIAIEVMKTIKVATRASMILTPVVADAVGQVRRGEVRALERAVFSKRRLLGVAPIDALAQRKALLDLGFSVGGARWVRWGDATVEDHRERIEFLLKLRAGIDRTIAQHEDAITEIEAAGVSCLNDIEVAA